MSPVQTLILILLVIIWVAPWYEVPRYCSTPPCLSTVPVIPGFQWRTKILLSLGLAAVVQIIKLTFTH